MLSERRWEMFVNECLIIIVIFVVYLKKTESVCCDSNAVQV